MQAPGSKTGLRIQPPDLQLCFSPLEELAQPNTLLPQCFYPTFPSEEQTPESTIREDQNIEQNIYNQGSVQKQIRCVSNRRRQRYSTVVGGGGGIMFKTGWNTKQKMKKSNHNEKMSAANNENQLNKVIAEEEKSCKRKL
ncbi:unnamed protein product [Lepeophtheirus salmonis]|uniref:(salmon louse) hypothetical protein n=1 Tax=Lepeophtheirus salmonis TaxID=72036 RepID=A0A7R8D2S3_LEPSM|nr:unnamed protein product [Lepeophtheirus salmonis]CAF3005664.1 unnamed protein product [Lepeophtheirus salmonis]